MLEHLKETRPVSRVVSAGGGWHAPGSYQAFEAKLQGDNSTIF
jgi:hypothetical protein